MILGRPCPQGQASFRRASTRGCNPKSKSWESSQPPGTRALGQTDQESAE